MPKYKVTYKRKITTSKGGEIEEHIFVEGRKTVRANSFSQARNKIRSKYNYDISIINVMEVKKSWIRRLFRF